MKVALLEPYFTGSHAAWAHGYCRHSQHHVELLTLPGSYWKWRMHGGAVTLAQVVNSNGANYDLLFATDMLDLTTFLALTRRRTASTPTAVYFHENQLTYPWSPTDRDVINNRDQHYGFINFASALAADAVFFNSQFHLDSFLEATEAFLRQFPDHRELGAVDRVSQKSRVLPLGLELGELLSDTGPQADQIGSDEILVLWNHRWEYDKNPDTFFEVLFALAEEGIPFKLAILGENFAQSPEVFERARAVLGERIVHYGFAESRAEYLKWLRRADILPVTSNQDFFGASVVEAIAAGAIPLLPRRVAFPTVIPETFHRAYLYDNDGELVSKLREFLIAGRRRDQALRQSVQMYDWTVLAPRYDAALGALVR